MVASWVAFGCMARKGQGPNVCLHRFPHENPEPLKKWVYVIRRKERLDSPTHHSWIGIEHLKEFCCIVHPGKWKITKEEIAVLLDYYNWPFLCKYWNFWLCEGQIPEKEVQDTQKSLIKRQIDKK